MKLSCRQSKQWCHWFSSHLLLRLNLLLRTGETACLLPNKALPVTNVAYFLPKQDILNRMASIITKNMPLYCNSQSPHQVAVNHRCTWPEPCTHTSLEDRTYFVVTQNGCLSQLGDTALSSHNTIFFLILKGKSIRLYSKFKLLVLFKWSCCPMGGNLIHVALASKKASLLAWSGQGWCFYTTSNAHIFAQVLFVYQTTVRNKCEIHSITNYTHCFLTNGRALISVVSLS